MSWVLLAVPLVPLIAGAALGAASVTRRTAARVGVAASVVAFLAATVALVRVWSDGRLDAVVTDGAGDAFVGLTADRTGAILVVLTTAVAVIVQSFASRSLHGDPRAARFHWLALLLTAATSVVAVAATSSLLVLAWLATSAVLVALIGHRAPWPQAVAARRRAAWSFLVGDAVLVLALLATVGTVGDVDLRSVATATAELDGQDLGPFPALGLVAVLLVLAGVARSALVPVHRWLPATLAAPTPVSALLHAGVVNGAGVLLLRFSTPFGSSVTAMSLAFVIGTATAFLATSVMLVRTDVKGALVWSTSGQMGFMVMQLGVGAFAAALFHIVGHALYKAALFLGAGGAITAHARHEQRPHLGAAAAPAMRSLPVRIGIGLVVPLVAFAVALRVIDPHLTASAVILLVTFGTLSIGRAANGWTASAPWPAARTVATAVGGIVVAVTAYVGGITLFERAVVDELPYDVPAAVGPVWVAATLLGMGVAVATVAWVPGTGGDRLRRQVYAWLQSTGTPAVPTAVRRSTTDINGDPRTAAGSTRAEVGAPAATGAPPSNATTVTTGGPS
jgi:NADH:ubiquinone oxidoreductase subunit 5 (subunit L)/multisubunit Na+/H+ antiporter MnhA subunit